MKLMGDQYTPSTEYSTSNHVGLYLQTTYVPHIHKHVHIVSHIHAMQGCNYIPYMCICGCRCYINLGLSHVLVSNLLRKCRKRSRRARRGRENNASPALIQEKDTRRSKADQHRRLQRGLEHWPWSWRHQNQAD